MRMNQILVRATALSLLLLASSQRIVSVDAALAISEVAYRGSGDNTCNGEDWIELSNTYDNNESGASTVDLTNYVLHDDSGATNGLIFPEGTTLETGEYLLLCKEQHFSFGIGREDSVTLLDPTGVVVASVVLEGDGPRSNATYASIDGEFRYTAAATPGTSNIHKEPISDLTKYDDTTIAAAAAAREDFFSFDPEGSNDGVFTNVVDIAVTIAEVNLTIIRDHPAWQEWVGFDDLSISRVTSPNAPFSADDVVASSGAGRIRVKGQSSTISPTCQGYKNIPFSIKFDNGPFLGMEHFNLRNHFQDQSFMRDHAANRMLRATGLPYLQTRPARLFLNGEYVGFYTLIEAAEQEHVMQRSFGAFDPKKTALFKFKSGSHNCPFDTSTIDPSSPVPDSYQFERGRHRDDIPVLGPESTECGGVFFGIGAKKQQDMARAFVEYNETCSLFLVEMGRVDLDFGKKSIKYSMMDFLDHLYDPENNDLTSYVDTDQWLQNFAFMATTSHMDSPIGTGTNNWYLATTNGGNGDWKIVQHDHNDMMTQHNLILNCGQQMSCGPMIAYRPILQPMCGPVEDQTNRVVSRILNSQENREKYLAYVREIVDILQYGGIVEELYRYGEIIAGYANRDPLMTQYKTVEDYERVELAEDTSNYNNYTNPFLPTLRVRLGEVRTQIDAIDAGSLPRNGDYDPRSRCPDWRNPGVDFPASLLAEDCADPSCEMYAGCFDHNMFACGQDGEFVPEYCHTMSPSCKACFPHSRCGSAELDDHSGDVVEGSACGPSLAAECTEFGVCFDHGSGYCNFDGEIEYTDCQKSDLCAPCFPNSRCGSGGSSGSADDNNNKAGYLRTRKLAE